MPSKRSIMSRAHSSISCARGLAGREGMQAARSAPKCCSWGKGGVPRGWSGTQKWDACTLVWGGVKAPVGSEPSWAPGKASAPLSSSGCSPLSSGWGLTGLPLPETDCLLLFLHLAGITSVFHCVICCLIATCNPSFLLCFLPRRCPQLPGPRVALRPSTPRGIPDH